LEYKVIKQVKSKHIKLVDASIMSECLELFPWAKFLAPKGGIKMHVSLDEATMIPEMINLTSAKVSARRGADNFRYRKTQLWWVTAAILILDCLPRASKTKTTLLPRSSPIPSMNLSPKTIFLRGKTS